MYLDLSLASRRDFCKEQLRHQCSEKLPFFDRCCAILSLPRVDEGETRLPIRARSRRLSAISNITVSTSSRRSSKVSRCLFLSVCYSFPCPSSLLSFSAAVRSDFPLSLSLWSQHCRHPSRSYHLVNPTTRTYVFTSHEVGSLCRTAPIDGKQIKSKRETRPDRSQRGRSEAS